MSTHNSILFEKNINALEQKYPDLATKIKMDPKGLYKYKVLRSNSGDPNVLVIRDQDQLFLYDNESPFDYCNAYFEGLNMSHAPMVLFLGLGLGYHLYTFMRFYGERLKSKRIIIFEEDIGLFNLAMRLVDLQEVINHPDIHLFVGVQPDDAFVQIRKEILPGKGSYAHMKSIKAIPLPSHLLLNSEYYLKALKISKKACGQMMKLAGNDPIDSLVGLDNMLMNIKNIVTNPGINLLYERFNKRPAVIVGAGPSLNKNMYLLREIMEKALIVSCDASFVPLMKRDIRPHIVVTMERTDGTEYFFEDAPDFEGVNLAICPIVRPTGFESFKGKKIIVNRAFSHFDWLQLDKGALSIGPGVSNMAFKVAEALGCDPIVLIGQDLAFADDGMTHVKEMVFGECDDYYYGDTLEVEGNDGKPIKTSMTWELFRTHLEEDIEYYSGLCINATEGGAKIRGTRVMTFLEAIDRHCREAFQPYASIEETLSGFDKDVEAPKGLEQTRSRICETRQAIDVLIPDFQQLHDDIRALRREVINPFMYEGAALDREALKTVLNRFLGLKDAYLEDQRVKEVMLHTLQPLLISFYNKFNFLPETYSDEACLLSAQIIAIQEWLGVVGQLFVSTLDSLDTAAGIIAEELGGGQAQGNLT